MKLLPGFKPNTLKSRILLFSITTVIVMGVTGFYFIYRESGFLNEYNSLMENILNTQQLVNILNNNGEILQKYKGTESRNYIAQLNSNREKINTLILSLKGEEGNNEFETRLNNLKKLSAEYSRSINSLIFSEEQDKGKYIRDAEFLINEISAGIDAVYQYLTDESRSKYRQFNAERTNAMIVAMIVFFIVILLDLVTLILFTDNLMKPVTALTSAARQVSEGSYHIPSLYSKVTIEEFDILTTAFRQMAENIARYVRELNEKVDIERKLKEVEVNSERTKVLLKEAELLALQSQVNPHFIFNTLNIIAKIAYTESADRTATIIGSMSKMLRYSLGSLKRVTTLELELNSLEDYIFIQKTRFADRLRFEKKIECNISDVSIPCLTIQPIVENAILHGIEGKEDGGWVRIRCFREEEDVIVLIADNGVGISRETLDNIFSRNEGTPHKGHTTGLGINNVKERLELLYGRQDLFEIRSEVNRGTEVFLRLPSGGGWLKQL